jgi:catechol 2,3-dioxygenase-like lactoylglutathione lyase family enzyme
MFTNIRVISVPVVDQQVAKDFYTSVLGATVEMDMPFEQGGPQRWVMLRLPGLETRLTLVTWFPQMPPGSLQGVVLATADIDAAHAELKRRGLQIADISDQSYGRECTFHDPDGNGWVLQQPAG